MATLIIDEGGAEERRVALGPGVTMAGSEAENEISFQEGGLVSPEHASFQSETTRWYVRDEGSRFGTFVNDRRVKEQGLEEGDVIELGVGGPRMRFTERDGGGGEGPGEGGGAATQVRTAFRAPGSGS